MTDRLRLPKTTARDRLEIAGNVAVVFAILAGAWLLVAGLAYLAYRVFGVFA